MKDPGDTRGPLDEQVIVRVLCRYIFRWCSHTDLSEIVVCHPFTQFMQLDLVFRRCLQVRPFRRRDLFVPCGLPEH